jgi:hypothetical protein
MAAAHEARVAPWLDPHLERLFLGETHPVYDFLFTYYSFTPGQLRRWHPGYGITLTGPGSEKFLAHSGYQSTPSGVTASLAAIKPTRLPGFHWLLSMLRATESRTPRFACYGLHEWAMVYKSPEVRHPRYPLRLSPADIASIVESQPLTCTHYDAFRFFTPPARSLNRLQLQRSTTSDHEQRGCLHANMDLYKWSYKLVPLTPSSLIADCFQLARDIREIDMRASPYDLTSLGFPPILIETPQGRAEYESHQRDFARRSEPLRSSLIALLTRVIHTL